MRERGQEDTGSHCESSVTKEIWYGLEIVERVDRSCSLFRTALESCRCTCPNLTRVIRQRHSVKRRLLRCGPNHTCDSNFIAACEINSSSYVNLLALLATMAEKERKRKRVGGDVEKPSKRVATESASQDGSTIKVVFPDLARELHPVIGTSRLEDQTWTKTNS